MNTKTLSTQPNGIPHIKAMVDLGDVSISKLLSDGTVHDYLFLDHDAAINLRDWLNEVL